MGALKYFRLYKEHCKRSLVVTKLNNLRQSTAPSTKYLWLFSWPKDFLLLRNSKFHYRLHKRLSLGHILRTSSTALGYKLEDRRFESRQGLGIFLFTTATRPALGPTQPPVQWLPGALSVGIKRPGHEGDRSPPPSAKVKECLELYFHSPNTPSWRGA
jgi:hypothetical protein